MKFAPEIINEALHIIECPYPLGNKQRFKLRNICNVMYGTETATFVGSCIWSYMPSELMESTSLNQFTSKIKTWKLENWQFKLCKKYLQRIGYLHVTIQYMLIDIVIYFYLFLCLFALLWFSFCLLLYFLLLILIYKVAN